MNHLAHLYLSQSDAKLMIGNFIADRVKGKAILDYPEGIRKGIEMHRAIDDFTDKHELVAKSKKRLYPVYGKYAAVIVDVFYDHILAKHWSDYSPITLKKFADNSYQVLTAQQSSMPEASQRILFYMKEGDWLTSYSKISGIRRTFAGLVARTSFNSKMEYAAEDLAEDYKHYEADFKAFFPELISYCGQWTRLED